MAKKKKYVILIEDDYEIYGNGLGNVASLQYVPSLHLMKIARKNNVKLTFMVDVAHMLTLKHYSKHPELKIQSQLLEESILLMKHNGFDVQLHLHPQWLNASYNNGYFYLNDNWNIGRCSEEDQANLISESINHLNSIFSGQYPEHKIVAFKAGSWGLQPSKNLFPILESCGISIVLGVRNNLKFKNQGVDYSNMEERYLPYFPNYDDITKVSNEKKDIALIPLQPYSPDLITFSAYTMNKIITKTFYQKKLNFSAYEVPSYVSNLSPFKNINSFRFRLRPYETHLKIGDTSFSYLKKSFDATINKLNKLDSIRVPILIECHSKAIHNYYNDIDKFFDYINVNYGDQVEFGDLSSFAKEIKIHEGIVRLSDKN